MGGTSININWKFVLSRFISIIGLLLISSFLLEGVIRISLPQQLIGVTAEIWTPADTYGWRRKPNLDVQINTGEGDIRLQTDENGFRTGANPITKPQHRILAIGDSFVAAIQVEYEQTMTGRLEESLSTTLDQSIKITNTGVGNWNPNQYLLQTREELIRENYDLLIVFVYLQDDIIDSQVSAYPAVTNVTPPSLRLPRNLSRSELSNAIQLPIHSYLERRSHLYILYQERSRLLMMRNGTIAPFFPPSLLKSEATSSSWQTTSDVLANISTEANKYHIPTLYVLIPGFYQVDSFRFEEYIQSVGISKELVDLDQPNKQLTAELISRQLTVIDSTPALRSAYAKDPQINLYGSIDRHFGPAGHQVVADLLHPILTDLLE